MPESFSDSLVDVSEVSYLFRPRPFITIPVDGALCRDIDVCEAITLTVTLLGTIVAVK